MYDINFQEKGELILHIRKFLLYPKHWNDPNNQLPIKLKWKFCRFKPDNIDLVPETKGIYCFVLKPKYPHLFETRYLLYIGKTNRTLRKRYYEYLREKAGQDKPRTKIYEMLNLYQDDLYFYYASIEKSSDVDACEEQLLNTFVPQVNTYIPKAKIKPELKGIYGYG